MEATKINGRSSCNFRMASYCRWVLVRQKYFTIITMEQSGFASGQDDYIPAMNMPNRTLLPAMSCTPKSIDAITTVLVDKS